MKKHLFFIVLFLLIFFIFNFWILEIKSAVLLDVSINEISWMGNKTSGNDEWIELYNNTDKNILLDGWTLKSQDGKLNIKLKGEISAKDFYLLERTNNDSVPNIKANLIYSGSLPNSGLDLKLYDKSVNLIDQASCSAGWFAGDNTTKQTMEKINPAIAGTEKLNWQTSAQANGTPKAKNSEGSTTIVIPSLTGNPVAESKNAQDTLDSRVRGNDTATTSIIYPTGVVINEILPSPEGADETNEYIELYNKNNFDVNLSSWKLKDSEGTITTFIIGKDIKILANNYLVFKRPETKISLNNSADSVSLLFPNDKIANSVSFTKSPIGQSYNLASSGNWSWSTTPTPASKNIITKPAITTKIAKTTLPKSQNSDNNTLEGDKLLASLSENLDQNTNQNNPWYLFLAVFSITIILAIIILLIKLKLKN